MLPLPPPPPLPLSLGMCICCSLVWGALPPSSMSTFDLLPLLLFSPALAAISGTARESHCELEGGTGQGLCLIHGCHSACKTVLGNELDQSLSIHVRLWPGVGDPSRIPDWAEFPVPWGRQTHCLTVRFAGAIYICHFQCSPGWIWQEMHLRRELQPRFPFLYSGIR